MAASIRDIVKIGTSQKTAVDAQAEVARGALVSITAVGTVIGLWSLASLVGAMVTVGGPFTLVKAWFSAVTGL